MNPYGPDFCPFLCYEPVYIPNLTLKNIISIISDFKKQMILLNNEKKIEKEELEKDIKKLKHDVQNLTAINKDYQTKLINWLYIKKMQKELLII